MAALVVCALCALVLLKPQEFIHPLQALPLLYILFGLALVAIGLGVIWRKVRPAMAPQIPYVAAFFVWMILTTIIKRPDATMNAVIALAIVFAVFIILSLGLASRKGLQLFAATFVGCAMLVTWVAIVQGRSFHGCMIGAPEDYEGKGELTWDGRTCVDQTECRADGDPDANYRCELVGPLGTASVGSRVRYRGSLADPNELSLMIAISIPFAMALWQERSPKRAPAPDPKPAGPMIAPARRRLPVHISDRFLLRIMTFFRSIPTAALVGAIAYAIILAQSRGGLLVFLTVLGLYFIRKAGKWGVVAGCLLAPPMLLVGGRSGEEAEESAGERVGLLQEAFEFIRNTKGVGLGWGGFPDESSIGLTAHNSYVLAAAEAGIVGACLFGLCLYASLKVAIAIWFSHADRFDDHLKKLAPAVAIAIAGLLVGIVFLSWTYKDILYIVLGVSAALYGVARAQDPTFQVKVSLKEAALVCAGMMGLLGAVYIGTRLHG